MNLNTNMMAIAALAAGMACAAEPSSLMYLCDAGWRHYMGTWHEKTGLVYGCPPERVQSSKGWVNHMFHWKEGGDYGAAIGDCPLILGGTGSAQQIFLFHFLEQGRQGAGIKAEPFTDLTDPEPVLFPQHHHYQILRVGQTERFQQRRVERCYLSCGRIQGKTELVFKLQRRIRHAQFPASRFFLSMYDTADNAATFPCPADLMY